MIGNNIVHIEPRVGESRITLANISKIKTHLKWNPTINLVDWINKNK